MAGKSSFLKSKIGRTVLVLLTAFLIFVGPTYMVHLMESVLKMPAIPSKLGGLFFLLTGVFLLWLLIRKRVIFEK